MKNIIKTRVLSIVTVLLLLLVLAESCRKQEQDPMVSLIGPVASPVLPDPPYSYLGNDDIATLGRVIFYDKNLSLSGTVSCGSCHKQQYAFADNVALSTGLYNGKTGRNSSAIINSPLHRKFWDGRAADFDTAVFMPVMNHLEMDVFNLDILPIRFSQLPYYRSLFEKAYGTPEINVALIRKALVSFAENLISQSSRFDKNAINGLETEGFNVFTGKGRCYSCHNGNDFNGYSTQYENIGLELEYPDNGRGDITKDPDDYGKFAIPTLRNIALSAPYMHDGRFKTLREVIDHYDSGIKNHPNLSLDLVSDNGFNDFISSLFDQGFNEDQIISMLDTNKDGELSASELPGIIPQKLKLTEFEKEALEAFMKSLTDNAFISDPKLSDPF